MKKEIIKTNKLIGIVINSNKEIIRIKNCEKAKKYFHRNYGHDSKIIEQALKLGLKEGLNEIDSNSFIELCDKLDKASRLSRTIKFCLKTFASFNSIKWKDLKKEKRHLIRNAKAKVQLRKAFKAEKKIK